MTLTGKVAIVTGGAAGIGYGIVNRFLREGAAVVMADLDEKSGQAAERALSALGPLTFVRCDVGNSEDVGSLVKDALDRHGAIDVLVNNAGIAVNHDFLTATEQEFDRVMNVNLKGPFLLGQAVARHMIERVRSGGRGGSIINISSIYAEVAASFFLAYATSKGGLRQMTKVMALALAPHGIRVNAIGPGSIVTEFFKRNADAALMNALLSRTPLGRFGETSEIASIATFLAGDESSYVTGQTIYADGGRLVLNGTVPVANPAPG